MPTPEAPIINKANIPVWSWLTRYWLNLVGVVVLVIVMQNESFFQSLGTLTYIPAVAFVGFTVAFLLRHLTFRRTLDNDMTSGRFVDEWYLLTPERRQILTAAYTIGILIFVAIVILAVAK